MLVEIIPRLIGKRTGAAMAIISPATALEKASKPISLPRMKRKGINTQARRKAKFKPREMFFFKRVKFLR